MWQLSIFEESQSDSSFLGEFLGEGNKYLSVLFWTNPKRRFDRRLGRWKFSISTWALSRCCILVSFRRSKTWYPKPRGRKCFKRRSSLPYPILYYWQILLRQGYLSSKARYYNSLLLECSLIKNIVTLDWPFVRWQNIPKNKIWTIIPQEAQMFKHIYKGQFENPEKSGR